jgi:glycosyltransferase involved in cell wall biosynthesis
MLSTVSVLIPTFRREALLRGAIESCLNQQEFGRDRLEVVVVDNSPEASAEEAVAEVVQKAGDAAPRVIYRHEPKPGISHARNTALRASSGDFIVFIDDDQVASPGMLAAYAAAWRETGADALFGPVYAEAETGSPAPEWILRYHCREARTKDRAFIAHSDVAWLGTSNSLFVRSACLPDGGTFDEDLGEIGGEDSLLLRQLIIQGCRFAWVDGAVVRERVSPERLRASFVRWRRFRSGQIRTRTCLRLAPPRRVEAGAWMAIGAAQVALYGLLTPMFYLAGRERGDEVWSRVFGGAGKILWTERFLFPAYGTRAKLPG